MYFVLCCSGTFTVTEHFHAVMTVLISPAPCSPSSALDASPSLSTPLLQRHPDGIVSVVFKEFESADMCIAVRFTNHHHACVYVCACVCLCERTRVCVCVCVYMCKVYMCVQLYPASTIKTIIAHPRECHVSFLSRLSCAVCLCPLQCAVGRYPCSQR